MKASVISSLILSTWQVYAVPAALERAACNRDNLLNAFTNPTRSAEASTFCSAYISVPMTTTSTFWGPGTCTLFTTAYTAIPRHPLQLYNLQRLPDPAPPTIGYNRASPTPVTIPGGALNYVSPSQHVKVKRDPEEPLITPSPTVDDPAAAKLIRRASSTVPLPTWLSTTYPASRISSACSCISPSAAYSTVVSINDYTQVTTATCTDYSSALPVRTYPAYCAPTLQVNAPQPLSHANWRVTPTFSVPSKMDCCDACTNAFNCVWWKFDFGTPGDPWRTGRCHFAYFTGNVTYEGTGNVPAICPNGVTQGIDPNTPKNYGHESNIYGTGYNFGACGNPPNLFQSDQDFGYPDGYQDCGMLAAPYYSGQC